MILHQWQNPPKNTAETHISNDCEAILPINAGAPQRNFTSKPPDRRQSASNGEIKAAHFPTNPI